MSLPSSMAPVALVIAIVLVLLAYIIRQRRPSAKRGFFGHLFNGKDPAVDSLIVITILLAVGFIVEQGWDVAVNKREFSPSGFGTGAGLLLGGGLGGGKFLRSAGAAQEAAATKPGAG